MKSAYEIGLSVREGTTRSRRRGASGLTAMAVALTLGCGTSDRAPDPRADDDVIYDFHETLQADAMGFDWDHGQFHDDFGDAAFFGAGFYARDGFVSGDRRHRRRAELANDHNVSVIRQANGNILWLLENLEEVFMATMGAIEYAGVSGDRSGQADLDDLIETMTSVAEGSGWYLDLSAGEFATDLYGPTSITAGFALIQLQYALFLADETERATYVDTARQIVDVVNEMVWNEDHYRYRPDEDRQFLYPNATMLTVLNRMYELTGEQAYLDRAETLYSGIQPLRSAMHNFYQSPYSAGYQGAQSDDYSTLSSQNYLTLGLMLTYQNTGDMTYLNEAIGILDFLRDRLYDPEEGKILHHWIDGRAATRDDVDYFCSGCNMQYLYIVWYLQNEVQWPGRGQ